MRAKHMMAPSLNQQLWEKTLNFDFDDAGNEYAFSVRLARENHWSKSFTKQAILEYKKFMYLAANLDVMVSPSHIVDTVWHQHLIFTQSYQQLCAILGKNIQHIPSTHHITDGDKFEKAKQQTTACYTAIFGQQPKSIWGYHGIFDSLNLKMARFKMRTSISVGLFVVICAFLPAYSLLRPIYVQLGSPEFLTFLHLLVVATFLILELYNRFMLKDLVAHFDESSFIYDLQPTELIYAKTQHVGDTINSVVNELIADGTIQVNNDYTIELSKNGILVNDEQRQVVYTLQELGVTSYPTLLKKLITKPVFNNTVSFSNAFMTHVNQSKRFATLFFTNFFVLAFVFMLSFTRVATGMVNEKPVTLISVITIVLFAMIVLFLRRLTKQIITTTIPDLYKRKILPVRSVDTNGQWDYFLFGSAMFTGSFVPLVDQANRNSAIADTSDAGCGTSCGSSCGGCGSD